MKIRTYYGTPRYAWRSPFDGIDRIRRELVRMLEDLNAVPKWEPPTGVFPLTNITEDNDNFHLRAELPGINAKDIDISLTRNTLLISGERKIAPENEK
ncbi:MAG: Hsp20/alpha crystallin family protein [Deltaproteobacteria bacterium]|nr:Hsp20/alpha crystallin family protein [Deltaproteobacteria bacterium]